MASLQSTRKVQGVKLIVYIVVGHAFDSSFTQRLLSVADPGFTGTENGHESLPVVNAGVQHLRIYLMSPTRNKCLVHRCPMSDKNYDHMEAWFMYCVQNSVNFHPGQKNSQKIDEAGDV